MEGVKEVRQLDDTHLHWVVELGGQQHEWDAVVTEQKPDEPVAWRNTNGKENAGVVTFHRIDARTTRLMVQLDCLPEGVIEKLGDAIGAPDRQLKDAGVGDGGGLGDCRAGVVRSHRGQFFRLAHPQALVQGHDQRRGIESKRSEP